MSPHIPDAPLGTTPDHTPQFKANQPEGGAVIQTNLNIFYELSYIAILAAIYKS